MTQSRMPDTISDVTSSRTGIGQIPVRTPREVRSAQLALASTALRHPRLPNSDDVEFELSEALDALGILNRDGVIDEARAKPMIGTVTLGDKPYAGTQRGLPRNYRFAGKREANGRLSRAERQRRCDSDKSETEKL